MNKSLENSIYSIGPKHFTTKVNNKEHADLVEFAQLIRSSPLLGALDNRVKHWKANVKETFLGIDDHGIFTFWITVERGCTGQAIGGYCLSSSYGSYPYGLELISEILKVFNVDSWEKLIGKEVRVWSSHCKVHAIQNVNDRHKWLYFQQFFADKTENKGEH